MEIEGTGTVQQRIYPEAALFYLSNNEMDLGLIVDRSLSTAGKKKIASLKVILLDEILDRPSENF